MGAITLKQIVLLACILVLHISFANGELDDPDTRTEKHNRVRREDVVKNKAIKTARSASNSQKIGWKRINTANAILEELQNVSQTIATNPHIHNPFVKLIEKFSHAVSSSFVNAMNHGGDPTHPENLITDIIAENNGTVGGTVKPDKTLKWEAEMKPFGDMTKSLNEIMSAVIRLSKHKGETAIEKNAKQVLDIYKTAVYLEAQAHYAFLNHGLGDKEFHDIALNFAKTLSELEHVMSARNIFNRAIGSHHGILPVGPVLGSHMHNKTNPHSKSHGHGKHKGSKNNHKGNKSKGKKPKSQKMKNNKAKGKKSKHKGK